MPLSQPVATLGTYRFRRRLGRPRWALALACMLLAAGPTRAEATAAASGAESMREALCRLIENSALQHGLPVSFFTRLIWQESSFRTGVVSPAGAQGVAQFMPGTAAERGLADPFDPEQAIPKAADLLADHVRRFGNLGLAAAAYNGGPARVSAWLARRGGLPLETQHYVARITGRTAEDWAEERAAGEEAQASGEAPASCLQVVALLRRPGRDGLDLAAAVAAPWGVQLAGNFSKERALSSFARNRALYATHLAGVRPMIIGTRLRSRGTRTFYRVRVPAETRTAANALCDRIRTAGGACVVLPS